MGWAEYQAYKVRRNYGTFQSRKNPGGSADFVVNIKFDSSGGTPAEIASGDISIATVTSATNTNVVGSPTIALVTKQDAYNWDLTFTHNSNVADGHVVTVGLMPVLRQKLQLRMLMRQQ